MAEEKKTTQEELDAIMRKYDRESNTRIWTGVPKTVIGCILILFSLYTIYLTMFANVLEQVRLSSFMGFVTIIGFLTYPIKKGVQKTNYMPWYDWVLMILGAAAFFYFAFNADKLLNMRTALKLKNPVYITVGIVGMVVLAELCRRSVGLPILCVAGFFVVYTIISFASNGRMLAQIPHELFYGENGILTTPVNVCSKYIAIFIIFGAFLDKTGIASYFINVANSVAGGYSGGPAKVAVISSALCGMVSGSSVGNTVTTGSVTIPMMKKTGYKAEFAGAVEASASTGGQIMPPIMGAAAFLMAEYVGVPYSDIIVRAILPAVLYFLGIFIAVHVEAKKLGLKGIPREQLPKFSILVKDIYLLIPLVVLVWLVCSNTKTMQFSASVAILAAIGVGIISSIITMVRVKKGVYTPEEGEFVAKDAKDIAKFTFKNAADALEAGGRGCITVAVACGLAGIICGSLTITGLASKLINGIVMISGCHLIIALVLTMLCCIVLGMGVPTTANYCIMASTCAPILIKMGIPAIAAHFFVFYFGIVADITPPVALAAYAGSAIAKGNPMKTGVNATRLAIAAFIIPYVFAYSPSLLFINTVWYDVVLITITAIIGMYGIAASLAGYMFRRMTIVERIAAIVGGLLLIIPGSLTDVLGLVLVGGVCVLQKVVKKD